MSSATAHHLHWEGCFNVRDLGGLPTLQGGLTTWGALVRSDALDGLTPAGWAALVDHGVRTVIDLRNEEERGPDTAPRPRGLTELCLPLDCSEDRAFWSVWGSGPQFGTRLYYRPHLERFPERSAAVLAAITHAPPGGVVFHCGAGRDRAGQIAMLVLALVGVPVELIAADYAVSAERLRARYAAYGQIDQGPELARFLAARGATTSELIIETLGALDVEATMRTADLMKRT